MHSRFEGHDGRRGILEWLACPCQRMYRGVQPGEGHLRRASSAFQAADGFARFEDLDGAVVPVVDPADDEVAGGGIVAVTAETAAAELELDEDRLPVTVTAREAMAGGAVGVAGLDRFDGEPEVAADGAEDGDDALLAGGLE